MRIIEYLSPEPEASSIDVNILQNTVRELQRIVDASSDELLVTDGEGRILLVTGNVEQIYGLPKDAFIGRSVIDLERERIFYPSVTSMVLRDRCRHTILQSTRNGRQMTVMATPVFDARGEIERIISVAIDTKETPWVLPASRKRTRTMASSEQGVLPHRDSEAYESPLIVSSHTMRQLMTYARKVAKTEVNVLLLGETGVGKNRVAAFVHQESIRASEQLVEINCAALPESLIESELFGYERGAFTGSNREGKIGKLESANGGTIFLNEIGELPIHVQAKLLDVVQRRSFTRVGGTRTVSVDIRIIAATNRDLASMVRQGEFRADLFYRLNVVPIEIPPLRARREDMEELTDAILHRFATQYGGTRKRLHPTTTTLFQQYDWPGNVRELENLLERLCVTLDEEIILPEHLPLGMGGENVVDHDSTPQSFQTLMGLHESGKSDAYPMSLPQAVEAFEAAVLQNAVARFSSTHHIARALQVSQPTIVRKLQRYGLRVRR